MVIETYLIHPVRVEHAEVSALASDSLLGGGAKGSLELELVDTLMLRFTVHDTLSVRALASSATDGDAVYDESLLGLVSETASLVRTGRSGELHDLGKLSVLPSSHTEEKAEGVALLLAPNFFKIFKCCGAMSRIRTFE